MKVVTKEKAIKRQYYLTCFDNLKLNYQKIPKAGTTSILNVLNKSNRGHSIHSEKLVKYITLKEAYQNGYLTFTVTRNPYDRARSMFSDFFYKRKTFGIGGHPDFVAAMKRLRQHPNFLSFLEIMGEYPDEHRDLHFKTQSFYCKHEDMQYFKLENFSRNIKMLNPKLDFNLNLHTTNSQQLTLTVEHQMLIEEIYFNDFSLWRDSL